MIKKINTKNLTHSFMELILASWRPYTYINNSSVTQGELENVHLGY